MKQCCSVVWLTLEEFEALGEYSCSLPTGTTMGKKWKRCCPYGASNEKASWYMGQYVECSLPGQIGIHWSKITRIDGCRPSDILEAGRDYER